MNNRKKLLTITLISFLFLVLNLNLVYGQNVQESKIEQLLNTLKRIVKPNEQTKTKDKTEITVESTESFFSNISLYKPVVDYEKAIINVVERASPAVVSIVISKDVPVFEQVYLNPSDNLGLPPEFREFFQLDFPQIPQLKQKGTEKKKIGGGTGFIVTSDGMILTNKHVVSDKDAEYTIFLNNGQKFNGKVLALHPTDDLAIVKIEAKNLSYLYLGNSDDLKLGQTAIAIGNALGEFQNTVSVGVISGLKRSVIASDSDGTVEKLDGLIQTDAAINPGNSGGPLLNLRGEVIGINTAIAEGAQSIGFTIPINRAKKTINDVKYTGAIKVPFLGVKYILIDEEVQKKFKLPFNYGAYIYSGESKNSIVSGSPAEKIKLKEKDIILEVDGKKINSQNSLSQIVTGKNVGQKLILKVWREGKIFIVEAVLGSLPSNLPQQ